MVVGAVVVGATVVGGSVAGEAVVVMATTAVVGTTVPPVDEEQPDASMAEANRTERTTWLRRTTRPFTSRVPTESTHRRLCCNSSAGSQAWSSSIDIDFAVIHLPEMTGSYLEGRSSVTVVGIVSMSAP